MTIEESRALAKWIVATGKKLRAIYLTHGHGDDGFGIAIGISLVGRRSSPCRPLLDRSPQEAQGRRRQVSREAPV